MSDLDAARAALRAAGYTCETGEGGTLVFAGSTGSGCIDDPLPGFVRVAHDVSAVADDPVKLARISACMAGSARITLRHRTPFAEQTCTPAELTGVVRRLAWVPAAIPTHDIAVEDVAVGVFDVALGALSGPVFLRLATGHTDTVNRARATYVLVANALLRAGKGGWIEGPGLAVVGADAERTGLRAELYQMGQALAVLGDERRARSYLELCGMKAVTQPGVAAPTAAASQPQEDRDEWRKQCGVANRASGRRVRIR